MRGREEKRARSIHSIRHLLTLKSPGMFNQSVVQNVEATPFQGQKRELMISVLLVH